MNIQEAIELVSYKLGLKNGVAALDDNLLNKEIVNKAIEDKESNNESKIDLKQYMLATKMLKDHRTQLFKEENEQHLTTLIEQRDMEQSPSGLLYKVIHSGEGQLATLDDEVVVHYTGSLIDTTVFDSSHERNKPATFKVKNVIKGWQEGLMLMNQGAQIKLILPHQLAYGERGNDSKVPPFATLVFQIELLQINQC